MAPTGVGNAVLRLDHGAAEARPVPLKNDRCNKKSRVGILCSFAMMRNRLMPASAMGWPRHHPAWAMLLEKSRGGFREYWKKCVSMQNSNGTGVAYIPFDILRETHPAASPWRAVLKSMRS